LARASCVPQEALRNVRKFKVAFSKVIRLLKKPHPIFEKASYNKRARDRGMHILVALKPHVRDFMRIIYAP
jgi:hypothetical protein